MANWCDSERRSSYSLWFMLILSTHSARPHSQRRSSCSSCRSNDSATCWMRSFTSRKTASLSPMRSSRVVIKPHSRLGRGDVLLDDHVAVLALDDGPKRALGVRVVGDHEEVRVVRAHLRILRGRQRHELGAIFTRTLAQKRDALDVRLVFIGLRANVLVRVT